MTKEEIEKLAKEGADMRYPTAKDIDSDTAHRMAHYGFVEGYLEGYEAAIKKAAEWLEKHTEENSEMLMHEAVAEYVVTDKYETKKQFINRFKNDML